MSKGNDEDQSSSEKKGKTFFFPFLFCLLVFALSLLVSATHIQGVFPPQIVAYVSVMQRHTQSVPNLLGNSYSTQVDISQLMIIPTIKR